MTNNCPDCGKADFGSLGEWITHRRSHESPQMREAMRRATLEEAERKMKDLADAVKANVPQGWGYAVLCYSFGENGFMNYVSNGRREDMVKALKELLVNLENDKRQYVRTERPE